MSDLLSRALRVIPSATQTFSKSAGQWPANAPALIEYGEGSHVWADDRREFVDFTLALGPMTLGYRSRDVDEAVLTQLAAGPIFSRAHRLETEVAEALVRLIPCAKDGMVKFGLSGSDATSAAILCARAYTDRDLIITQGYHGWHAWASPNRTGVAPDLFTIRADDWRDHTRWGTRLAAIIIEPEYTADLPDLREFCTRNGIVLIFDEVLTGFRIALGGYQEYIGIMPDLATFSKAMGNGHPISAVVGKRDIMRTFEKVGFSGTFLGDTIGLAAAKATIAKMEREPVIARLWSNGEKLRKAFDECAREFDVAASLNGFPPRMTFHFPLDTEVDPIIRDKPAKLAWRTLFAQEMIRAGVLCSFGLMSCYAHSDPDVERACEAMREAFRVLASVDDPRERLLGEASDPGVRAA